jgi:hypothetical protein
MAMIIALSSARRRSLVVSPATQERDRVVLNQVDDIKPPQLLAGR